MTDLQLVILEHIDMRSFSNLWFWIALAVMWSTASHWVIGVPFDMVTHARKYGGQAQGDLEELVRINTSRLLYIGRVAGIWLLGLICFLLSGLAVLGLDAARGGGRHGQVFCTERLGWLSPPRLAERRLTSPSYSSQLDCPDVLSSR